MEWRHTLPAGRPGMGTAAILLLLLLLRLALQASGQNPLRTATRPTTLTIGAVITRYPDEMNRRNDGWGFENTASAIQIAIDKFQAAGGLMGGMKIRIVRVDDACDEKTGVHVLIDLYKRVNPDVIVGPSCSAIITVLGLVISYWKIPYWPYGGTEPSLDDKVTQDVMVRIHATGSKIGVAFVHVFEKYGWRHVSMITSVRYCDMGARGIHREFQKQGYGINEWIQTLSERIENIVLDDYLDQLKMTGRVFIVCFDDWSSQQRFFERAEMKGMTTSEYVYLSYSIRGAIDQRVFEPWKYQRQLSAAEEERLRKPFYFFKQITLTTLSGREIEDFYEEIPVRLAGPPFYYNESLVNGWKGSWQAVNLHDACLTYLTVVNESLRQGQNYRDGRVLFRKMVNRRIEGQQLQSPLLYDENADRVPNFWLWSFSPFQNSFDVAIEMVMTDPPDKGINFGSGRFWALPSVGLSSKLITNRMHQKGRVYWGTEDGLPPPDTPACGFYNELCTMEPSQIPLIVGCSVSAVVVLGFIIGILVRQSRESSLQQVHWQIRFEDLEVSKKSTGRSSSTSENGSSGSISSNETHSSAGSDGGKNQLFTKTGHYKGIQVAIKWVDRDNVVLSRKDLLELKTMREMSHDNINVFVGACVEPPNICSIEHYCSKGSLQDILENDEVKLDWSFKMSFISDLIAGMAYLHKSDLVSHGNLKSGNCLIDARWVLKISGYGLRAFKDGLAKEQTEYEQYREMLWTAPELLRMPHKPYYGSQKADVYSFAIILQEIVYRALPYFLGENTTPKDVVQRVARGVDPPFRPRLQELHDDTNAAILDVMLICWYEDPNDRPDFDTCRKKVLALNNGKKIDMMANILNKLEKYTGNLEEIVNQRTGELVEEKKKTDLLLYSMMPASVAEQLKHGQKVDAQLFDEVTVYFSDIVGFTAMSSDSTPMQVVNFLNDLYTLFDDIIRQHNVYKVETIGDAYMVVGGLPTPIGNRHVGEIANMALDLLSAVYTSFRARHRPTMEVKLRGGFHTGPCASGVVGLTMPRYCLFGDTVNTASRMESNGEAMKIHISEAAYQAIKKLHIYKISARGQMEIKGKGLQTTYWLVGKEGFTKPLPSKT